MPGFDTWESYFYPETYDAAVGFGTLRNKLGERDFFALRELEYAVTAVRDRELHAGLVSIDRTYGVEHLQAIHRHLFQDVYEWAGEFRTVNMAKPGGVGFARTRNGEAQRMIDAVQEYIGSQDWSQLDRDGFGKNAAVVFAFLNQAHPFREGNGRTSKMFMHHVAELSNFSLDFSRVDADVWNRASALSSPQRSEPTSTPSRSCQCSAPRQWSARARRRRSLRRRCRTFAARVTPGQRKRPHEAAARSRQGSTVDNPAAVQMGLTSNAERETNFVRDIAARECFCQHECREGSARWSPKNPSDPPRASQPA